MLEYGIFIGDFHPFHLGHLAVINEIIIDGLKPALLIDGIDNAELLNEIGFTILDVVGFNLMIAALPDATTNDEWIENIKETLTKLSAPDKICIYYTRNYGGIASTIIDVMKKAIPCEFKEATFPAKLGLSDCGVNLKRDLETYKHYLPGAVYCRLKEKVTSQNTVH